MIKYIAILSRPIVHNGNISRVIGPFDTMGDAALWITTFYPDIDPASVTIDCILIPKG